MATTIQDVMQRADMYAHSRALEVSTDGRGCTEDDVLEDRTALYATIVRLIADTLPPTTILKPFTACQCFDEVAKRFCKDNGKCSFVQAQAVGN